MRLEWERKEHSCLEDRNRESLLQEHWSETPEYCCLMKQLQHLIQKVKRYSVWDRCLCTLSFLTWVSTLQAQICLFEFVQLTWIHIFFYFMSFLLFMYFNFEVFASCKCLNVSDLKEPNWNWDSKHVTLYFLMDIWGENNLTLGWCQCLWKIW